MDYTDRVTVGLVYDVLQLLAAHGIVMVDDDCLRHTDVLTAVCQLADAVAGPPRDRRSAVDV